MAFSEVYVDPSIAADSGTGTIGDPFGDLEYAIEQTTFDTTNGTRFNIKSGTDEVIAANLYTATQDAVTTPAYVPGVTSPLIFQGYTAVAGDGGIGGISCGGAAVPVWANTALDYIHFIDLHLHNSTTTGYILQGDNDFFVLRCEIDNVSGGSGGIDGDTRLTVLDCYIHNVEGRGVLAASQGSVHRCHIIDGPNHNISLGGAIESIGGVISDNIVELNSAGASGIEAGSGSKVWNNSIYQSAAGTGYGIRIQNNDTAYEVANNLVEGFNGVGGRGINVDNSFTTAMIIRGNAVYDCTTDYETIDNDVVIYEDNETLTESPFTDAANGDFSPVDTGNVKEGSLPNQIGGGFL